MKKNKISRILGVALTLALLTSMLLGVAPVSADVTPSSVTVTPATISAATPTYNIRFLTNYQLAGVTTCAAAPGAYYLADPADSITFTATAGGDTVTLTPAGGSTVNGVMSGAGTFAANVATFAAIGETCTVTAATGTTAGLCNGNWARTGTPTAAVTAGGTGIDTITVVFPADTTVAASPTGTITAGPGWINGTWASATTGTFNAVGTPATRTVVITLNQADLIGEGSQIRLNFTAGLINPSAIGTYTLTVATSKETTAVVSGAYSITKPIVPVLAGIVQVFNPAGVLMSQATGPGAIAAGIAAATATGYGVQVGPGTYSESPSTAIAGVTIQATGAASETIVIGNWAVNHASTTISGFTLKGTVTVAAGTPTTPVVIKNNSFTHGTTPAATAGFIVVTSGVVKVQDNTVDSSAGLVVDSGIVVNGGTTTVTGTTFTTDETDTAVSVVAAGTANVTVDGCTFAGSVTSIGYGTNAAGSTTDIVKNSTFTGQRKAIMVGAASAATITLSGNSISGSTVATLATGGSTGTATGAVSIEGAATILIEKNDIETNAGFSVDILPAADGTLLTVQGNNFSGNTFGLRNMSGETVNAYLNWWGAASGPTIISNLAGTGDIITGTSTTNYKPWATVGTSQISTTTTTAAGTTDKSTTVGISFTTNAAAGVGMVTLAKYTGNPAVSAPRYTPLADAYFDVYVPAATGTMTILFYASGIDANTKAYYYSTLQQAWTECSNQAVAGNFAYVLVTVTSAAPLTSPANTELGDTPFVLVTVPPAPTLSITSPAAGVIGVVVTPTLVWSASAVAVSYQIQLAEDPSFATLAWSRSVNNAFYAIGAGLEYSTTYYWRVRAQTATTEDMVGPWATGVFTTMAEPVVVAPPTAVETAPPVVNVEVAAPVVTVEPTPVTTSGAAAIPDYLLWTIVGIGAILIIALIVLIVRTRRVA